MAKGVWKGVYPWVFGRSRQRSQNKFLDPSTPSMRKVDDGEEKRKKKRKKRMAFLVATTSLPAVYRPNDDRWNAERLYQYKLKCTDRLGILTRIERCQV